jgi:hypothetical protein
VFFNIGFTQGTAQALYNSDFFYADFSTPSNFTIFAFHKQEPLSDPLSKLSPHLSTGPDTRPEEIAWQNKSFIEIDSSRTNRYQQHGNSALTFAAGCEIFFGKESFCSMSLRQLLIIIGCNKRTFHDHISLDDRFVAEFMLAVNRRFQRWLGMCKHTTVSQSQANNQVLQFNSVMEDILDGQFDMTLSATFKKIKSNPSKVNHEDTASGGSSKGSPEQDKHGKKRVINQELTGSAVRNNDQLNEFKMRGGETWTRTLDLNAPRNILTGEVTQKCAPDGTSRVTATTLAQMLSAMSQVTNPSQAKSKLSCLHGGMQRVHCNWQERLINWVRA